MTETDRAIPLLLVATVFLVATGVTSLPVKDYLQRADLSDRLSDSVTPSHYQIEITTQFQDGQPESFTGSVIITANLTRSTSTIALHKAENINIQTVKVFESGSDDTIVKSHSTDPDEKFIIIELVDELSETTDIFIHIEYEAVFSNDMYGFYISRYTVTPQDGEETEHVLLATQFQPTHTRKAFPCFDQPEFKAIFEVTLVIPEGYHAISNAKEKESTKIKNVREYEQKKIEFHETPLMSTYLLAFIVYREDSYSSTESIAGSLPFKTWARTSEISAGAGDLSQEQGPIIIKEMEEYTGLSYSDYADKIDQAAIPDFSFGGMENWGLVMYRETALLYKAEHSQAAKKRVTEIIAHELTHQWFGNLVTTEWWDSLWLNEGFATLFEYYLTDKLHKEWRMMERLVVDEQLAAFGVDATHSSSPLTNQVNTDEEVMSNMGTITYSKGGSVLRMFSNILGEPTFRTALQNYLRENALGSVKPTDLFEALTLDANVEVPENVNLTDIFESWTNEPGFPVVHVTRSASDIKITQERFLLDGTKPDEKYNVYFTLISNDETYAAKNKWLLKTDDEITIDEVPESGKWVLVETSGYFRVNYDQENWELLTEHLLQDDEDITPLERAMLIDNALNLARANKLSYSTAIQLLDYLKVETDYIPWSVGFSNLNFFHRMLGGEDVFEKFVLHIIDEVYETLGFKVVDDVGDDMHIEHVHRANVLNWACRVGHENCSKTANEYLQKYLDAEERTKVAPDLRSTVYCYGVKNDEILWTKLWSELGKTDDATERSLIIAALGCSTVPSTLYMYLESTLSGNYIRTQDTASVFSSVYSTPEGAEIALEFLHFNARTVERSATTIMNAFPNIIRGIAQNLKTEKQKKMLEEIRVQLTNKEFQEAVDVAIDTLDANMLWLASHKATVLSEMEAAAAPVAPTTTAPGGAWATRAAGLPLALLAAALSFLR